jgi:putative hemolysin
MDSSDLWKLILLLILLALSAFFSGSETALISLSRVRLTHLVSIGKPGANRVSRLIQNPARLLATVLLGNNLVNTAAAALGTALALKFITNDTLAVLASTIGVTLVLLVFGETLPKNVAYHRSEMLAFALSRPLVLVGWILAPGVRSLLALTSLTNKALGITGMPQHVGEEEIRTLIAAGAQSGTMEASEAELLDKVFHFGDRQVREVMTPRPDVIWVEQGATLEEFLAHYSEHAYTRFPVYQGSMDNIVGVLSAKDVLLALGKGELKPQDSVTTNLRPPYFVPETKTVASTFVEMQQSGYRMIITVDEFGGIAGLVTLTQLMEVIVGQVGEEGAAPEEILAPLGENTFRVDAGVSIAEINEELNLDIPAGDYQTVAGFILDHLGHIPQEGEAVEHQGLKLTVMHMDGLRIEQVELRLPRDGHQEGSQ